LGELLPVHRLLDRLFQSPILSHMLGYPAACLALRLLTSWLRLPALAALLARPLLWLLRGIIWRPRWWLALPVSGAFYLAAERGLRQADEGIPPAFWMLCCTSVSAW
jgi:hypothetical protein